MVQYGKMLLASIEDEKNGKDYRYSKEDRKILNEMLGEINACKGTDFHYLAEIDAFNIPGTGEIMARYITEFPSESVRGFLVPQLVSDKIKDCDQLILKLYLHFKASDEYISGPGEPAPAHIYVSYDNAFRRLKPKKLKNDLLAIVKNPRDAFYLPFTTRMLASWRVPEMRDLLIFYSDTDQLTMQDVGLYESEKKIYPPFEFIKRQLKFTAIDGLRYYPSLETREILESFLSSTDKDIQSAAKRTLEKMV